MNKNYGHILRLKVIHKNHIILNNYPNNYSEIRSYLFNVFLRLKNIFTKYYIFHKKIFMYIDTYKFKQLNNELNCL